MIPEVREKIEIHIKQTEIKIASIYSKYKTNEQMQIKDLEDIKRLSEIIRNLSDTYKTLSFTMSG